MQGLLLLGSILAHPVNSPRHIFSILGGGQIDGARDDLALGGEHTMQYTDDVSYKQTLETYVILLTNVTSINLT